MTSPASALAIVAGLLAAGPAAAQVASIDARNSPAALRCSALGQIDEAERPAAIYFMAGYSSGERDATAFATVGPADTLGADVPQGGTEQAGGSAGEPQALQSTESTEGAAAAEQPAETTEGATTATEQPAEPADGPATEQPAEAAEGATAPAEEPAAFSSGPTGGPPAAVLPTVPVEAVLAACGQSPDSRIIDIIVAQGALGTD